MTVPCRPSMQPARSWARGILSAVAAALVVSGIALPSLRGQAVYFTWSDASGIDNTASDGRNWLGNSAPSAESYSTLNLIFDGAQTSYPSVNADTSIQLNSITFQGSTGFGINASNSSTIEFTGGTGSGVTSGVFSTSTSTSSILIAIPIVLQGAITVSNTSSSTGLIMTGGVSGTGDITVINSSSAPVQFSGVDSRSSGTTIIQSGTLQIGDGTSTTATLAGNVSNSGTLLFDTPASGSQGFEGSISGSGSVSIGGASGSNATFTLSGTNSYTGTTTVSNVTLQDTYDQASFAPQSALTINSGGTVDVNFNETIGGLKGPGTLNLNSGTSLQVNTTGIAGSFTGTIAGTSDAGVTIGGTGKTTFSGSSTYSGGTTILSGATLIVGNSSGSATGSGAVTINSGGTFQIGAVGGANAGQVSGSIIDNGVLSFGNGTSSAPLAVSNQISGTGTVTIPNSSAADFTNDANSYSGGTTISSGGILSVSNPTDTSSATGTGTITINAGGTLNFGLSSGSATGGASGTIANSGTLNFYLTSPASFGNTLSGVGALNANQSGKITFTNAGSKTYTGITTINSGATIADSAAGVFSTGSTMNVAAGGTLQSGFNESIPALTGSGTVNLTTPGSTLTLTTTVAKSFGGAITGSGNLALNSTSSQTLTGSSTYTGTTTVTSGTLIAANTSGSATGSGAVTIASGATLEFGLATGSASGSVSGPITDNGSLAFDLTSNSSFANTVSGTGGLSINMASMITITGGTGALTYSGPTNVNVGTLADQMGFNNAFSPHSIITVSSGATLDVNSNETVGGISGRSGTGGNIVIASGADLTLSNTNSLAFQGIISGSGGIEAAGVGGTTILTNANTFSGAATIDAGSKLRLGNGVSTNAGLAGPIVDNGTLILDQVASGNNVTFSNSVSGTGSVSVISTSTLVLPTANTYSGGTTITTAGTLSLTNTSGSALGTGPVTVGSSTPTTPFSGASLTGSASFAGQLNLNGGGLLGPVSVNSGTGAITPGTLAGGSGAVMAGNSALAFFINDANGVAGTNWNQASFAGTLSLTATPSAPLYVSLSSLNGSFMAGQALNFDPTKSYSWQFISAAGGITGFDSSSISVTTAAITNGPPGFANSLGIGSFFLSESGNDLFVNFTPIPEPSTWVLMAAAGAGVAAVTLLRQKRAPARSPLPQSRS